MTGYTVHTGSTEKFSKGWDQIFGAKKDSTQSTSNDSQAKPTDQQTPKKS